MSEQDQSEAPVLVTGATGYVAGWIVKELLDAGRTVHAAVRDPENTDKHAHLDRLAADAPGRIEYFKADLLQPGSYADAMAGCEVVFHTASPFTLSVEDARRDLVEPAQMGTRNVLEEAGRTDSVRRVVVTSSCAAIYGDNADLADTAAGVFTESDWNTSSSLGHQPYSYSKTLAEQEAWRIAESRKRWDLVTINPSFVIGPGVSSQATSASFELMKQFGDGSLATGVPDFAIGAVDVRDVARAHVAAAFTPEASGRYIVSAVDTSFPDIAAILRKKFGGEYPIPKRTLPKWLVWLMGPIMDRNMTRKLIARNVGLPFRADNSRGIRELGLDYRPLERSVTEMFQQLADNGLLGR